MQSFLAGNTKKCRPCSCSRVVFEPGVSSQAGKLLKCTFHVRRYGCSKWAVEVLLKELHARWGVPVKVFRCGMILSHTSYLGQINPTDFFTRLLCGIAYTGIAPQSFYTLPHGPEEHFDGMPIDFVSGGSLTPLPIR